MGIQSNIILLAEYEIWYNECYYILYLMLLEVNVLKRSRQTKSQRILMNSAIVGIVILTALLTFSIFITFTEIYPQLMSQLSIFFQNNRWWILSMFALFTALLIVFVIILNIQLERFMNRRIRKLYRELETKSLRGIANLPIGVISYEEDNIIWTNNFFTTEQKDLLIGNTINTVFQAVEEDLENIAEIEKNWFIYPKVHLFNRIVDIYQDENTEMFYMIDKTREEDIRHFAQANQLIIGYIYADSPEEIRVMEDSGNLEVSSEIHRTIINWAQRYNAHARKYSSYRWLVIVTKENLNTMIEDKMNVREEISKLSQELKINVTISGGFAGYFNDMNDVVKNAINAIELGQSRGGDQIIVHNYDGSGEDLIFGGNNNQKKRSSRVMARSTALALHTEFEKQDVIYVTGHQYGDLDSIGAMLGIYQIAVAAKKTVYFVGDLSKTGKEIYELSRKLFSIPDELKLLLDQVILPTDFLAEKMPAKSCMVIVDTGTIKLLETEEIAKAENIMLIDHHRKGKGAVQNTTIEYIDPFSSSASELVTELIQYQPFRVDISIEAATFLLAGIILDTHNFTRNVSSRTFEAASYLRKQGAIQNYVLQTLSVGIDEYVQQSEYLKQSEEIVNNGRIIILEGMHKRQDIAKCADFLLEFPEIKYAIAITKIAENAVAISARSKGSVNIQRVMEHIGGGGHFNSAAAQLIDVDLLEVKEQILDYLIEEMTTDK